MTRDILYPCTYFGGPRDGERVVVTADLLPIRFPDGRYVLSRRDCGYVLLWRQGQDAGEVAP